MCDGKIQIPTNICHPVPKSRILLKPKNSRLLPFLDSFCAFVLDVVTATKMSFFNLRTGER